MKTIEKAVQSLLETNPYYAYFFLNSKIEYDTHGVKTAAAGVVHSTVTLIFNSEFMASLTHLETAAVVEHEILHLLFEHHRAYKDNPKLQKNIANIAMDISINQSIQNLPAQAATLAAAARDLGLVLAPEQSWEYYYRELLKHREKLSGQDSFDQHDLQEAGSDCTPQEVKALIKAASDKAQKAAKGVTPLAAQTALDGLSAEVKIPWKQVLANFVARCAATTNKNTRKKANRRFGTDQPGKNKKRELVLGVCADSSGSVSDENYAQFLSEVQRISSLCSKVYFIDADRVVQQVTVLTKKSKLIRQRSGRGGTAYQPAITACVERKCDAIIYFGDFDTADTPTNPGVPFLWVGVGTSQKPGDFGTEIRL